MNAIVAIVGMLAAVFIFGIASNVSKERAKTQAECYKAAQVNTNIKCEAGHE